MIKMICYGHKWPIFYIISQQNHHCFQYFFDVLASESLSQCRGNLLRKSLEPINEFVTGISTRIMLLPEMDPPHSDWTVQLLQEFYGESFDHLPQSLDLEPSGCHLFMNLWSGLHFTSLRVLIDSRHWRTKYGVMIQKMTMLINNVTVWITFGCNKSSLSLMEFSKFDTGPYFKMRLVNAS